MRLDDSARDVLRSYGLTAHDWARWCFPTSRRWHGDDCGCSDDRCIGYHHAAHDPCPCLPALLDDWSRATSSWPPAHRRSR